MKLCSKVVYDSADLIMLIIEFPACICHTGHPEMVLALCTSPGLLARYLRTCCDLLQISDCTHKLAALFDPSKPCNKLAIRKLFLTPKRQR